MRRCASSSARKKARPFFVFFLPSLFDDDLIPLFFEFSVCVLDLFSFVLPRRPRRSTRRSTKAASLLPPPPSSPPGALPRPPPPPPDSSFSAPLPVPLSQKTEHVGNAREAVDALAAFVSISSEAAPKASAEPRLSRPRHHHHTSPLLLQRATPPRWPSWRQAGGFGPSPSPSARRQSFEGKREEEKEKRGGEESVEDERIVFLFFEPHFFLSLHTHFFFRLIFRRWSRRIEKHSFFFLPRPSLSLSQPQLVQEVAVPSSSTAQRERRQEKRRESSSFFWKLLLCSRRRRRLVVVAVVFSLLSFSLPLRALFFF